MALDLEGTTVTIVAVVCRRQQAITMLVLQSRIRETDQASVGWVEEKRTVVARASPRPALL